MHPDARLPGSLRMSSADFGWGCACGAQGSGGIEGLNAHNAVCLLARVERLEEEVREPRAALKAGEDI